VWDLERVTSNSGGVVLGGFRIEGGAVGETRSSRHSLRVVARAGTAGEGVVESVRVCRGGIGTDTDWKAWMGRASKNSWAIMKGVFAASGRES